MLKSLKYLNFVIQFSSLKFLFGEKRDEFRVNFFKIDLILKKIVEFYL